MIYCFDIDGTLCTKTDGDYPNARPFPERIAAVNALQDAGHVIKLFTARGSTTGIDWRAVTEEQMKEWNVQYDELILGKPEADLYIDDRCVNAEDWLWKIE